MRTLMLTMMMLLVSPVTVAGHEPASRSVAIERHYCTQYGPFFIRFDPDKAAGVFTIHNNGDLGSIVGRLDGLTLDGEWIEVDSRGEIRLEFTSDWSRFEARYNVAGNPETWHGNWTGILRPADAPATIEVNETEYRCI